MDALQAGDWHHLLQQVLLWIGYAVVVGLLAKAVMPGRDPGGTVATVAMGITGVIIGCGTWLLATGGQRITPMSGPGLLCGTGGALVILVFYRVLGGRAPNRSWSDPSGGYTHRPVRRRRSRRSEMAEMFDD